ncbi:hypothetical protein J8B39_21000 [Vibrio parahaemolyticus]|uniref:hypothetical protein n=1 Tax=Vibrio vulnificus TaxID=672 RepID=UPI00193D87EC|nr:hypothetical protein [Vibrio parahaemolyticus]MBM5418824.1 hypothetical protein [Vibrio parahaemolyticus]MCF9098473.1 hypothetical protein [Vibrio parahaemolyticus]MCF9116533.1 hypothetical protein [Vibrio parahaemolyticus]
MRNAIISLAGAAILSGCANPMVEQYRADTTKPIIITDYYQTYPNSAGGVKVHLSAFNMTDKPIKYFDFWAQHYDRVGELQSDDITGSTVKGYRFTGPYLKEKAINGRFGPSFYDFGSNCMVLDRVEVTYMDSTKLTFTGEELKKVIVAKGANCRNLVNR